MNGFSVLDGETRYRFVRRGPDFWTGEYSLVAEDGATTALPLPVDAEFEAVLDGYVIAKLNSALDTPAGTEQPGALLAWSLDDVQRGRDAAPFAVFRPSETQAVEQVAASENKLWVKVLDDVSGKLIELTPDATGWTARDGPACQQHDPDCRDQRRGRHRLRHGRKHADAADTLCGAERGRAADDRQRTRPVRRNKFTVEQKFATSKDGTKVPYYLVRPRAPRDRCPR